MSLWKSKLENKAVQIQTAIHTMHEDVAQKAMQGDVGTPSVSATMPQKVSISSDPVSLMRLYNGFAYACGSKIASYVSAVPVHLYAVLEDGEEDSLHTAHKSLTENQLRGMNAIPAIKSVLRHRKSASVVEITDHPLLDLIKRPNDNMSWPDFVQVLISYFSVIGNCYLRLDKEDGQIKRMHPLLSEFMWLFTDGAGTIKEYLYAPSTQEYRCVSYTPDDILHLMRPSAGSVVAGRGWLEAVQKECRLIDEANNHMIALANNMGQPGCAIHIRGKVGTEKEKETIVQKFLAQFSRKNRGKPIVLYSSGEKDSIDIKPMGISPKDMAYNENLPWLRSAVCAASGVPEDLVHSSSSNRASSQTAMASFLAYTVAPQLNAILEQLNHRVVFNYDSKLFFGYDPAEILRNDPVLQASVIKVYLLGGIITPNEARAMIDMAPMPGYDTLIQGNAETTSLRGNDRNMAGIG
jgi:HK97 family phage portal protein